MIYPELGFLWLELEISTLAKFGGCWWFFPCHVTFQLAASQQNPLFVKVRTFYSNILTAIANE